MAQVILLAGLLKLELPGQDPIRLCDGGFVKWNGETYLSDHPVFGTVAGFAALTEGVGDELPAGSIAFLPPKIAAAVELSRPGYQGARLRMWVAEIDKATGEPIGEPELAADWLTDKTVLKRGANARALEVICVTHSQRLLARNEGNSLSTAAHQRVFPGETGHDNAVGMDVTVAWGVAAPARGIVQSAGGGGGVGGNRSVQMR